MPEVPAVTIYHVLAVLVALGFVVQAIYGIRVSQKRLRGAPVSLESPVTVRAAEEFARRHELAELGARVARMEAEIKGGFAGIEAGLKDFADEARQGRIKIYERIERVSDRVVETGKSLGERLARVEGLEEAGRGEIKRTAPQRKI
jgi:hypothetical protein